MRPAPHNKKKAAPRQGRAARETSASSGPVDPATGAARPDPLARKPLKPIGPAALRSLREEIESGRYPSDAAVIRGLMRILRKQD